MLKKILIAVLPIIVLSTATYSPLAYSSSKSAVLVDMHNKVQVKTSSSVWKLANLNNDLNTGDSIRTGVGSRAEIRYIDGTITRLGPSSVMRIENKDIKEPKRTGIRLLLGKLWLKVTKGNGLLKIQTPTATASVLGTELFVSNNEKNVSHITTLEGLVEVSDNQGDKTLVKPGEWVEIVPGEKLEKPTKFDWDQLKRNERFMLDPTFKPAINDFNDDSNWK